MSGSRLKACVDVVLALGDRSVHQIFGSPDGLKFCSCLTLCELASADACFGEALERFCAGRRVDSTIALAVR